jgi:iron complex transport system substrate-binding protein
MTDCQHSRTTTTSRRRLLAMAGASAAALGTGRVLAHAGHDATPTGSAAASPVASPAASPVAGAPITVPAPLGDVTLPGISQRVVAIEWNLVEYVLALGVQPVAIADIEGYNAWVDIGIKLEPDVADVGLRYEPNLESIAAVMPDLILGITERDEAILDQLSGIAPTILLDSYPTVEGETPLEDINDTLRTIAIALGKEDTAEQLIAETDMVLANATTTISEAGFAGVPFVLTQAFTSENVPTLRLFNNRSLFGYTVSSLGLTNAWEGEGTIEDDPWGFQTVTVEALVNVPPETHLFYVVQDDDNIFADALTEDPIWSSFPFVQEGRTYALGGDTWTFGGHQSVQRLIEKVIASLTQGA